MKDLDRGKSEVFWGTLVYGRSVALRAHSKKVLRCVTKYFISFARDQYPFLVVKLNVAYGYLGCTWKEILSRRFLTDYGHGRHVENIVTE